MSDEAEIEVRVDGGSSTDTGRSNSPQRPTPAPLPANEGAKRAYNAIIQKEREAEHARVVASLNETELGLDAQEREVEKSFEVGDWSSATKAQRVVADLAAQKNALQNYRAQLETAGPVNRDPVQDFLGRRTPQAQNWLKARPHYAQALALNDAGLASGEEAKLAQRLHAAHLDAMAEGHAVDSEGYFKHVQKYTGDSTSARQRQTPETSSEVRTSDPRTHVSENGSKIFLTKGEAERSRDGSIVWTEADYRAGRIQDRSLINEPIGPGEYGRRKREMIKQGYYDRM